MNGPTYVYFIATEDRSMVKIGCSKSPPERLKTLTCWSPQRLVILAAVPGVLVDERALHGRYLDLYSHHEWFRSSSQMLADAAMIARLGQLPPEFRGKEKQKNPLPISSTHRTPEWRARVSEVHKARWAREKRERAASAAFMECLAADSLTAEDVRPKSGPVRFGIRHDGSVYIRDVEWVERFVARHQRKASAA